MIKIHEKLWVAINPKRDKLAYMTHFQEDKLPEYQIVNISTDGEENE